LANETEEENQEINESSENLDELLQEMERSEE